VITIQREAAENEIVEIDHQDKIVGFNNNIYSNCNEDHTLISASPVLERLLPKEENERVKLAKKLRKEGKIKGPSGRLDVKLSLFDDTAS